MNIMNAHMAYIYTLHMLNYWFVSSQSSHAKLAVVRNRYISTVEFIKNPNIVMACLSSNSHLNI